MDDSEIHKPAKGSSHRGTRVAPGVATAAGARRLRVRIKQPDAAGAPKRRETARPAPRREGFGPPQRPEAAGPPPRRDAAGPPGREPSGRPRGASVEGHRVAPDGINLETGLARVKLPGGKTVDIAGALEGELIDVGTVTKRGGEFVYGLTGVREAHDARVRPRCPVYLKCGSCTLMHASPAYQLDFKRRAVIEALRNVPGVFPALAAVEVVPSQHLFHYRQRVKLVFAESDRGVILGQYARNSHQVVDTFGCDVQDYHVSKVVRTVLDEVRAAGVRVGPPPDRLRSGGLRYLAIQRAVTSGEMLVVFVGYSRNIEHLQAVARRVRALHPEIAGVLVNVNAGEGDNIFGPAMHLINGRDYIEERLCGVPVRVSAAAFFQVNPRVAEQAYNTIGAWLAAAGAGRILEGYAGIGALTLVLARTAKKLVAVEASPAAAADATYNLAAQNAKHVKIETAEFGAYVAGPPPRTAWDTLVVNPPRKGVGAETMERMAAMGPKRVAYLSCDPASLARDAAVLAAHGFTLAKIRAFDFFPQTVHVETAALFEAP